MIESTNRPTPPTREELQAELLEVPEPLSQPPYQDSPGIEAILAHTISYIRGKRGADLLSIILVGSAVRRALTPHSDLNLIVILKGQDEGEEIVRVADRLIEIRYRAHKKVDQELPNVLRLPSLLRKARVLYDHEMSGAQLVEKAAQRFRQGPPPIGLYQKIHLKADCFHRLGKADDMLDQPAAAQYLLNRCLEDLMQAFFLLRGFWPTAPTEMLRFIGARDPALGECMEAALTASSLPDGLAAARAFADLLFKDIPNPVRID
jgi:predicted nucleotidyltransferase